MILTLHSAASLKYHTAGTVVYISPGHIILATGQPVFELNYPFYNVERLTKEPLPILNLYVYTLVLTRPGIYMYIANTKYIVYFEQEFMLYKYKININYKWHKAI